MDESVNKLTDERIKKYREFLDYKSQEWKDDWYMNNSWRARTNAFKEALEVFNKILEGEELGDIKTNWQKFDR